MIRYSRLHRWGNAERLVNPGKVIVHEMQDHGMGLILDLLTKGIGQSRHASHTHPHREILSFDKTRGYLGHIWVALHRSAHFIDMS